MNPLYPIGDPRRREAHAYERVGDLSSDFSPPFELGRPDRLAQAHNWRRAQSLAGRPDTLNDLFVAFNVCPCNGWSHPMCDRHRQWAEDRRKLGIEDV